MLLHIPGEHLPQIDDDRTLLHRGWQLADAGEGKGGPHREFLRHPTLPIRCWDRAVDEGFLAPMGSIENLEQIVVRLWPQELVDLVDEKCRVDCIDDAEHR